MDYLILILTLIIVISIRYEAYKFKQGVIKTMATLEETIQSLKDSVTAGFQSITDATQAAADRVIASLQAGNTDAAVSELEALKQSVSDATAAEVDKLNAVDPAAVTPTP